MSDVPDLWVRNSAGERVAAVVDFADAKFVDRFCASGTWQVKVPAFTTAGAFLALDGSGIEIERRQPDGTMTTLMSGPTVGYDIERDGDVVWLSAVGVSDSVWVERRLAHPQPATAAPPYNSQTHDVRTGAASTVITQFVDVNAGPSALIPRRVPGLTIGTDPVAGRTVTGRGRWQQLSKLCTALAGADVGWRVRDLVFETYVPRDVAVVVSDGLGNLGDYKLSKRAAGANALYIGGGGTGVSRTIFEGVVAESIASWGRVEDFTNRSDTVDSVELATILDATLGKLVNEVPTVRAPVIEGNSARYGIDYALGDRMRIELADLVVFDAVRQVTCAIGDDQMRTDLVVGPSAPLDAFASFAQLGDIRARLRDLERT